MNDDNNNNNEKKQLELLETQNKHLKDIKNQQLVVLAGLLGAMIGLLSIIYFKLCEINNKNN